VSLQQYPYRLLATWVTGDTEAWVALGNAETRLLRRRLRPVEAPVYICGLARAGTTILTEGMALHPEVATHTYRDFPCLFTPYFWNRALSSFDWIPHAARPQERAHKDGIMVTPRSPEAMEEMLWMAFFPHLHDEGRSAVLDARTHNPAFADFYRAHIQKLLSVRKKSRYASKANYNITRIPYIASLFTDARFVIVVRRPDAHVWSLHEKHRLFCEEQDRNKAAIVHMDQSGHFEFGRHRALIHTGDDTAMAAVRSSFATGDDVRGWARYWAMMHRFIRDACLPLPGVRVVRHEDLCKDPQGTLRDIFAHCRLAASDATVNSAAALLRRDVMPMLPEEARAVIHEETNEIAAAWAYG
jgi:hypothetical protein